MNLDKLKAIGLYFLGTAILGHQAFYAKEISEPLLFVALALVGIPSSVIADRILTKPVKVNPPVLEEHSSSEDNREK